MLLLVPLVLVLIPLLIVLVVVIPAVVVVVARIPLVVLLLLVIAPVVQDIGLLFGLFKRAIGIGVPLVIAQLAGLRGLGDFGSLGLLVELCLLGIHLGF